MNKNLIISLGFIVVALGVGVWALNHKPNVVVVQNPDVVVNPDTGGSSGTIPSEENTGESFGRAVTLKAGQSVTFTDGLKVYLKEINDSRCKSGVQCIWQGEISGTFEVSGGKISGIKEVFLGTERNKTVALGDYTFNLTNATTSAITFIVSYKKTVSGGPCYIGGCSAQICSDQKDVVSTCEYTQKYACYKTATCERQPSGQCGWTLTPALSACLSAS
jgi:hypothetical protein